MERRPDGMIGITRRELHELVWAKPRRQVAASMGVTDFILVDACRKAAVPTPSSGHWTKISLGKASDPVPLPPTPEGVEEVVIVGKAPRLPPSADEPNEPGLPKVTIPDLLRDPHPMVAEAKVSLERQAAAGDSTLHWHKTGSFQVRVGQGSLDRVLRFLDAILKAAEAHGHRVSHGQWKWWVTFGEAHLIALACSPPPEGRGCWTLRLLAERMVELGQVETLSYETVRCTLKKARSSRI